MLETVQRVMVGGRMRNVRIDGEVNDIARRLHEGDATVGWQGDPELEIRLAFPVDGKGDPIPGQPPEFQVWGVNSRGEEVCALSWPRCDASLLRKLAEMDPRRRDAFSEWERLEAARIRDEERQYRDSLEAFADKVQFGIMKDLGHLDGQTRRVHSMYTSKDD